MGGCSSKNKLNYVDDSVHVMLQHDKKQAMKANKPVTGYVPRAPHPLLDGDEGEQGSSKEGGTSTAENK